MKMATSYVAVFFAALFALQGAQALTDEQKAEIMAKMAPIIAECGKNNGDITIEYLKELREQKKRPDDSNACFFACIFKKVGLLDAQGLFSEEKAIEKGLKYAAPNDVDKVKQAVATCAKVNQESVSDGEKGCDRAKLIYSCIADQREQLQHYGLSP